MGAIVVAMTAGLVAIGLVAGIVALAALALAGIKVVSAAHESGSWLMNRPHRQRTR
ncbi:hypothetical protein IQ251_11280 [Saccharopolyspora sp. HNM0983]|uniref:Uncharacterized protein n=1 Tax=Saccharopolyspora montiporae TaxID=2781240 RepID=A0A929G1U4_9PSEU|nr:hypothetical protein [Saccharopolyspora sp. HNM0983]MBE9375023.1 hypothetical protein [Saccharopolyspora sp. HNM0983]